jgi:8-amino-3,8-dideoxy-alpha-D-manno-octulosonate transaminase
MPGFEVIGAEEQAEVDDVFRRGGVLFRHGFDAMRGDCYKVREFEAAFAAFVGAQHALAVTSCTAALRVALASLHIGPGDEVITQSFTFVATAEAIIESGATPVCAEIDETFNMDPRDLERRITKRTRAVIVVHMLGTPARLSEIQTICRRNGLSLIEDAAWGCGASYAGQALGTWGEIGTYSFDYAKTMTTGEGGMLVFKDHATYERAAAWHDHGHENNPALPRWEDSRSGSGFNYRMMELQGAIGLAQLRKLNTVVTAQRKNRELIWDAIRDISGVELRTAPRGSHETADALVISVPDRAAALRCRTALLSRGISTKILPEATTWHFAGDWSHMPELVDSHGGDLANAFPRSRAILERAVSLPVMVKMSEFVPKLIRDALCESLGPARSTPGYAT